MKHNYHSHTPWSHHASIVAEDSIKKAIKLGFKTWGFSEHSLQINSSLGNRLKSWEDLESYVQEIKHLKIKYEDQIDIKIGMEFDYRHDDTWEPQIHLLKEMLTKHPEIDYVLYAPHFFSLQKHSFNSYPSKEEIETYVQDIDEALTAFDFKYIVHPDGFTRGMGSWTEDAKYLAQKIISTAIKHNVPLGLNANGLGYGDPFCYPRPEFWKIAAQMGAKVILELDSHSSRAISQERIDYIEKMAKDTGVKLINKLDI